MALTDEDYKEIVEAIAEARGCYDEALSDKGTAFFLEQLSDKQK